MAAAVAEPVVDADPDDVEAAVVVPAAAVTTANSDDIVDAGRENAAAPAEPDVDAAPDDFETIVVQAAAATDADPGDAVDAGSEVLTPSVLLPLVEAGLLPEEKLIHHQTK